MEKARADELTKRDILHKVNKRHPEPANEQFFNNFLSHQGDSGITYTANTGTTATYLSASNLITN